MKLRAFQEEMDLLSHSIVNSTTLEIFETDLLKITNKNSSQIQNEKWLFDWHKEIRSTTRSVYGLHTLRNSGIIQGLISIEDKQDHVFMHLIENASFNKGKSKVYQGVLGNLVAYACKFSMEIVYSGFVAFDSKTALIEHYAQALGATHFRGLRMFIDEKTANKLVKNYFR